MAQFDVVLAEAFGFDEGDVAANRRGALSPRQQQVFHVGATAYRAQVPKVMVILGIAFVVAAAMAVSQAGDDRGQVALALGATLVAISMVALLVRKNYAQADRFDAGAPVQVVCGPVAIDEHPYDWRTDGDHAVGWKVSIGDIEFRFLDEQAAAFQPGGAYAVYYADFGQPRLSFLSAERA